MNRTEVEALRDALERDLYDAVSAALRSYLSDLRSLALAAVRSPLPNSLLAASTDEMPGLGTVAELWAVKVDAGIMSAVRAAFDRVFRRYTDAGWTIESPEMEGARDFLASVRDRLVRGTHFGVTVYEASFDRIRGALAMGTADGWSRQKLAQRISAELAWEKDGPYWRNALADVDHQIDSILDAIGPPGDPTREQARLGDHHIQSLRDQRNIAIKRLDEEKSIWKTRAELIARTESTGANNYGAIAALRAEGVATKEWVATHDPRTRPTHRAADGQTQNLDAPFLVGAALLQFPGDPTAPVETVANCRCCIVGGEE